MERNFDLLDALGYSGIASMIEFDVDAQHGVPFGILEAQYSKEELKGLNDIVARIVESVSKFGHADLNLLKALLRRCRIFNSDAFVPLLETHFEMFLAVFHDLVKTMRQLYSRGEKDVVIKFLRNIYSGDLVSPFIRYWSDWLTTQDKTLVEGSGAGPAIRANGSMRHQANAAVVCNDLAWIRGFRSSLDQLGDWDRRAVVGASKILSREERGPFLSNVRKRFNGHIVDKLLFDYVSAL